jgi:hypothetical protein
VVVGVVVVAVVVATVVGDGVTPLPPPGEPPLELTICPTNALVDMVLGAELNTYGDVVPRSALIALYVNAPGLMSRNDVTLLPPEAGIKTLDPNWVEPVIL